MSRPPVPPVPPVLGLALNVAAIVGGLMALYAILIEGPKSRVGNDLFVKSTGLTVGVGLLLDGMDGLWKRWSARRSIRAEFES